MVSQCLDMDSVCCGSLWRKLVLLLQISTSEQSSTLKLLPCKILLNVDLAACKKHNAVFLFPKLQDTPTSCCYTARSYYVLLVYLWNFNSFLGSWGGRFGNLASIAGAVTSVLMALTTIVGYTLRFTSGALLTRIGLLIACILMFLKRWQLPCCSCSGLCNFPGVLRYALQIFPFCFLCTDTMSGACSG